jgi:hypothetical protein
MRRLVITLLTSIATIGEPPAAASELGVMALSGQLTLDWTARRDDGEGGFVGRYRLSGNTDDEDRDEVLLSGLAIACAGVLHVRKARLWSDVAWCRVGDGRGNGLTLSLIAEAGPWIGHRISICVIGGEGYFARVRGEGTALRGMQVAADSASPWGVFAGEMRWRLLPSGVTAAVDDAGDPPCPQ